MIHAISVMPITATASARVTLNACCQKCKTCRKKATKGSTPLATTRSITDSNEIPSCELSPDTYATAFVSNVELPTLQKTTMNTTVILQDISCTGGKFRTQIYLNLRRDIQFTVAQKLSTYCAIEAKLVDYNKQTIGLKGACYANVHYGQDQAILHLIIAIGRRASLR